MDCDVAKFATVVSRWIMVWQNLPLYFPNVLWCGQYCHNNFMAVKTMAKFAAANPGRVKTWQKLPPRLHCACCEWQKLPQDFQDRLR
jgi:hypothetical protein